MTQAPAPARRNIIPVSPMNGAAISSGRTWAAAGDLANWIQSQGACLVAGTSCDAQKLTKSTTYNFHYRTKTRVVNVQRLWTFAFRGVTQATNVTVSVNGGTSYTFRASTFTGQFPASVVETVAAKSSAEADLKVTVTIGSDTDVWMDAIRCYEVPRPMLNYDTTDYGVLLASEQSPQPIDAISYESIYGTFNSLVNQDPRRVGLYHWAVPAELPLTRTSNVAQNLLTLTVPVLQRILTSGATTAQISWSVYAKIAGGGTAVINMSTDGSAASDNMSVTSAAFAWTTTRTVSVDCEDLTAGDGRRSTRFDGLQFAIASDGVNQLSLAGISVWDATT